MKKLATRDFEDLLQVNIIFLVAERVINGSLNSQVFNASLRRPASSPTRRRDPGLALYPVHVACIRQTRLHTASTLTGLKATTKSLGQLLRDFVKKVCPKYQTQELPREEAARARRRANATKKREGS